MLLPPLRVPSAGSSSGSCADGAGGGRRRPLLPPFPRDLLFLAMVDNDLLMKQLLNVVNDDR